MSRPPLLVLMAGLPGSGKTTLAHQLEARGFLRFSPDELVWQLHGHYGRDFPRGEYRVRERPVLDQVAADVRSALQAGRDVVMDHGFWTADERRAWAAIGQDSGASVCLIYLPRSLPELWERVKHRNDETYSDPNSMYFTEEDLRRHSSRFEPPDSTEPHIIYTGEPSVIVQTLIGDPPAGTVSRTPEP